MDRKSTVLNRYGTGYISNAYRIFLKWTTWAKKSFSCWKTVSYTHLRAHETRHDLVCRLLLEKKKYTSPSPRDKRQSRMPSSAWKKKKKKKKIYAVCCVSWFYTIFYALFFFLMIRRPPRSTHCISSAASDVYKRQVSNRRVTPWSTWWPTTRPRSRSTYAWTWTCLLYTSPSPRD